MSKLRGRFTSQILMAFSENLNFTQYIFPYLRESKNTVPTYNCLLFKIEFKTTGTHFLSKTSMTNDLSFQIRVIHTYISPYKWSQSGRRHHHHPSSCLPSAGPLQGLKSGGLVVLGALNDRIPKPLPKARVFQLST